MGLLFLCSSGPKQIAPQHADWRPGGVIFGAPRAPKIAPCYADLHRNDPDPDSEIQINCPGLVYSRFVSKGLSDTKPVKTLVPLMYFSGGVKNRIGCARFVPVSYLVR